MNARVSTLNPYAAAYVPLAKREAVDQIEIPKVNTQDFSAHGSGKFPVTEASTLKSHGSHDSFDSLSQNPNIMAEKQMMDEEFDLDLEYLRMNFPGICDQSLTDVYLANKGDLEATIDMLNHLEFYTVESPENLPDTLDIGDVSEPGSTVQQPSLKLKNVVGETSASTSGSSEPAVVT